MWTPESVSPRATSRGRLLVPGHTGQLRFIMMFLIVAASCIVSGTAGVLPDETENQTVSLDFAAPRTHVIPRDHGVFVRNLSTSLQCRLRPTDPFVHSRIAASITGNTKMIEYMFSIKGYSYNPLDVNNTWTHDTNAWARVGSGQGQTIRNLVFNYGMLSLMTLTYGVEKMDIELEDMPQGCVGDLNEEDKVDVVLDITIRDMEYNGTISVLEGRSSVCYKVIRPENGRAHFTDRCCYYRLNGKTIECFEDVPNKWLRTLDILLACLMLAVFVFGPVLVPDWTHSVTMATAEYGVILKEHLYKTMVISRCDKADDLGHTPYNAEHVIDLRNRKDFIRCRGLISALPSNTVIPIKLERFDIMVNYRKLLPENRVPVGMIQSLTRALFLCKLRQLEPFDECCHANIFGCCTSCKPRPWINPCTVFGRVLLVLMLPIPFYVRVTLYYLFEHPELEERTLAASNLGLSMRYDFRLMQYLTPTHPIFLAAFIVYFSVGMVSAWLGNTVKETRYQRAIIDSFTDLKDMSWLNALALAMRNLLLPFKKYGMFGCFLGLLIWPIFLPLSALICFVYCLPIVFITCRIIYHIFKNQGEPKKTPFRKSLKKFEVETLMKKLQDKDTTQKRRENMQCTSSVLRNCVNLCVAIAILTTLYSGMLMAAEVSSFFSEIICFTMMGLIVNASKVLRYGSLIFLVLIYSYDTYNNVNKRYLKLNKALFMEIQRRIKDLEDYTSLPSNLQQNRGFKACENSEQADYEADDDLSNTPYHWDINDLILMVDSEDTPRIPKKLFEEVCSIQVAGSPGPVYRSLLQATGKFLVIVMFLLFVFIVIQSFGESYKISSTNQTIATLAGGFLPMMVTNMLKPSAPQVETGLVSFKSKLEEIIKHFRQSWPMYDLVFDVGAKPASEEDKGEEETVTREARAKSGNGCDYVTSDVPDSGMVSTKNQTVHGGKGDTIVNFGEKHEETGTNGSRKGEAYGQNKRMLCSGKPQPTTNDMILSIKSKAEEIEMEPATHGTKVDILIILSERDQEWLMDRGGVEEFQEV